ncbi:hypothetical protein CCZ01_07870 [Helicobacter monodelphidis]|uniref:hypothetical protein n=1 Tax=Helicobacter sp. 15-1451 TaxID=2004995 RepID=UPI000DCB76D3|nr:hypothetical protein [Helicobacter sp. 15-1451]RAX56961.1 hypothetical protein CCZ01_07870 [Helicobacter sp. 15-1451]
MTKRIRICQDEQSLGQLLISLQKSVFSIEERLQIIENRLDKAVCEVTIKEAAILKGVSGSAIYQKLWRTKGIEPQKDFFKRGRKYYIRASALSLL